MAALSPAALSAVSPRQRLEMARVLVRDIQTHRPNEPYETAEPEAMRAALSQLVLGCQSAGELDHLLTRVDAGDLVANLGGPDRARARRHMERLHRPTPGDWNGYTRYLEEVAEIRSSGKNSLELLVDGAEISPAGLKAIEGAQDSINLTVYALHGDRAGERVVELLCEKARAGVEVRVLLDGSGTEAYSDPRLDDFFARFRAAGVECIVNPPSLVRGHLDHRKILVVDGKLGFTGGSNIGDHYHNDWHDQQTLVRGPAVHALQEAFFRGWGREGGKMPKAQERGRFFRAGPPVASGAETYVVPHEGGSADQNIKAAYLRAIQTAERRITIANPYFTDADVLQALCNAARRGVQVQVLLPAVNDVWILRDAARGFYPDLIEAGVEVYEYQGRVAHQKVAVIDGLWTMTGSSNLDARSLRNNDELNVLALDPKFAATVQRRLFDVDLHPSRSTRIREADPSLRERLARFVSPLL